MAYTIPIGAIAEVTLEGTQEGQQVMSVFHYRFFSGSPITDGRAAMLDLLNRLREATDFIPKYAACITNDLDDMLIFGQWISPIRYAFVANPEGPFAGTVAPPTNPVNVACSITKIGEQANRHNIGTLHFPGVPRSFLVGSELQNPGLVAYNDFALKMKANVVLFTGQVMQPVIFNRTTPAASVPIVDYQVQRNSRTMHRRTVGLGS